MEDPIPVPLEFGAVVVLSPFRFNATPPDCIAALHGIMGQSLFFYFLQFLLVEKKP
jgi:hypothetical protein